MKRSETSLSNLGETRDSSMVYPSDFARNCNKCDLPIIMSKGRDGRWRAYDAVQQGKLHDCPNWHMRYELTSFRQNGKAKSETVQSS